MKNKLKFISFSLLFILVLALSFGCTPTDPVPNDEGNGDDFSGEIRMELGFLDEKYIEDDNQIIVIEANEQNLELEVIDSDLFDSLEPFEYYMVSYNEDNVVRSIEVNNYVKDLVMESTNQDPGVEETTIISKGEKFNTEDLTLLDSFIVDINENGNDENISMYTRAEKDEEGNIMWDDGQDWIILVESQDKDYVLFNNYVQLGSIELFVYTIDENFYISTIQSGTANLKMTEYKFNRDSEEFEANVQFTTEGNVNMIHSSK